jgi:hypothetical protein
MLAQRFSLAAPQPAITPPPISVSLIFRLILRRYFHFSYDFRHFADYFSPLFSPPATTPLMFAPYANPPPPPPMFRH